MSMDDTGPVLAAGAVCWREGRSGVEVLLINRARHSDVSLPKGKVDPGESTPVAAAREISEETGFSVTLGPSLGTTEYLLPNGRDKVVYYWAAEVTADQLRRGRFKPNEEVQSIEWVSIPRARKRLSYERDIELLDRFDQLSSRGDHRTFALIALRHAKADPDSPDGTDAARTLSPRGRAQSLALVPSLQAWGPSVMFSSPAVRCLETVTPLADAIGAEIKRAPVISQEAWEEGESSSDDITAFIAKRVRKQKSAVLCSHSPVLPELIDAIARASHGERDGRLTRAAILATAEFTVVHLAVEKPEHGIVAIESHSPIS